MGLIVIVEENEPFQWTPDAEDGSPTTSVFTLQVLSEDSLNLLRKKHRHTAFEHGQRVENFNAYGFASDVVDQALLAWQGVVTRAGDPLPCDRKRKLALPERLKTEVLKLCGGKEAGGLFEGDGGSDPNASSPSTSTGSGTSSRS